VRILVAHNHYRQEGGEDRVFAAEVELLRSFGHDVRTFTRHNDEVAALGRAQRAMTAIWNSGTYRDVTAMLEREPYDIVHVHNTLAMISPSVYYAARDASVPVVQTLHNYRLMCPAATFLRDGKICEDCMGRLFAWPGVLHACYRESRAATATVASTLAVHKLRKTYTDVVDQYIALTEFGRSKFVEGGIPPERISVRPNYLTDDPGAGDGRGRYALFVGRLSHEKGIATLLAAWHHLIGSVPLQIIGDGPLSNEVADASAADSSITWLGRMDRAEVLHRMRNATVLVLPSEVYEAFPLTIVEAFASGTPVIATDVGALREIVSHGKTGLHFTRGDARDLARRVEWLFDHPSERDRMSVAARSAFSLAYTPSEAHRRLMDIYRLAQTTKRAP
jgi:glycosyltransferase involved in cell wall biosynthesis